MGSGNSYLSGSQIWPRRFVAAVFAVFMVVLAVAFPDPANAQDFDPFLDVEITDAVNAGDTQKAVAVIDSALETATDPRLVEDLMRRRATLHANSGDDRQAAADFEDLAGLIAEKDGETAPELIEILENAAKFHENAGDFSAAMEALARLLKVLSAAALDDQTDRALAWLDRLADSDVPVVARQAASVADAHREKMAETSRDIFAVDPEKGFTTVRIYYATDRARTGKQDPNDFYGGERGDEIEMGTAEISLPPHHTPGDIERPSIWTLQFREDPGRHVVLKTVTPGDAGSVFGEMRDQLAETKGDSAFVFVHGFNVPFYEAAQRTAQMAFDMNFDGLPILFSWPSRASMLSYISDSAVVDLSGRRLSRFLEDVTAKTGATRIHLIAHSMGNRALTDALELYALRHRGEPPAFGQVLFTAPDLDAGLFAEMIQTIRTAAKRITLYASNKDWALAVSRRIHGDAPRAGQGGENIVHLADVDSVDMTSIGDDMLAHSYYANNPSALTDILSLFWRDAPPQDRCGMEKAKGIQGDYWQYTPAECDSNALLSTLSFLRRSSIVTFPEARAFMNRFVMSSTTDPEERSRLEKALARLFR